LIQHGKALAIAGRCNHPSLRIHRHLECGLAERRRGTANDKKLALFDLEIAEQTGPGGRVSFRNCRQLGPRQIRLNKRDIRGRRASVLSVAAFMVRPNPPISAATFAPTAKSPPRQDFTTPTHSMPLTGAASAHSPRRICTSAWLIPKALIWMTT